MPRSENANSYVNAGFLYQVENKKVLSARICFGGISPKWIHAKKTEKLMIDCDLYTNKTLQNALKQLADEVEPDRRLPDASPVYRKALALSLFYKSVISTCPSDLISDIYLSGGDIFDRPLSCPNQIAENSMVQFDLDETVKSSGEAMYTNDLPHQKDELWAAFVCAHETHSEILSIDATRALV